jgi:hypothetical protein
MKIKLLQLVNSRDAISGLIELPLPPKTAFQVARFQKAIEIETSAFDVARINLLTPYANEEGIVNVPREKTSEVDKALAELINQEIEVEFEPLLDIEKLTNYWELRDVAVKPVTLLAADFLFKDF